MDRHESRRLLHADFDAQANRTPDAVALSHGGSTVTYGELRAHSLRLAGALQRAGIGLDAFVGLHLERSIDYYAAVLALLRTGAAAVPLPPSYPTARIQEILTHAGLEAVIDDAGSPLEPLPGARILRLAELAAHGGDRAAPDADDPARAAFVLCSSGSTGKPKLIVRSHQSFYHRLEWTWERHPYGVDERCVQKSAMTTTHSLYELFEPLLQGVPVWILDDEEARDLAGFWDKVNTLGITRLLVVPSALQVALEFPGFAAPAVRVLVLMGEYVHPRLAGRALESFPTKTCLYSIYGSTEASSALVCDLRGSYRPGQELPLGAPISPAVQAHVLGADLQSVATGEVGVLHIGGSALFSEYFHDPELTASAFVRSPVIEGPLFDTHDQVRLTTDGQLHFVGRTDHTVKVRGFRVDLQEVERTLLLHPELHQAAVLLSEDAPAGGASLLGFYAPASVDRASVRRHLVEHLPSYMVPSVLVGLEALPRASSGKTDRRQLLADYRERASQSAGATAGHATTADEVGTIWGTLLAAGPLAADVSFFEAGGTSLTAFAAMHRLREAFGLDRGQLPDQALYRYPTPGAMAALVDRLRAGAAPASLAEGQVLVSLRGGADPALPPVFLIASAGGTLGAYAKLAKALRTPREIIGVRDPYIWGGREATCGFRAWIDLYLAAIRQRQLRGPYHIVAYSSAGAFGYEIARRLRLEGDEVALLALIDPLSMDRSSPESFGFRAMQSRFDRPYRRWAIRLEGWWRTRAAASVAAAEAGPVEIPVSATQFSERVLRARRNPSSVRAFAALLQLNSGMPFGIGESELSALPPERYFAAFLDRVRNAAPELDTGAVERIFDQYEGLQVPAQQAYPLHRYEGRVLLVEPQGSGCGLIELQLRPHVPNLEFRAVRVGPPDVRVAAITGSLSHRLREHYLCMRDDRFVTSLGAELDRALA